MKEIEETWANVKFSVSKYMKGNSDRGFVLGTVDEVLQTLDDNAMQLQVRFHANLSLYYAKYICVNVT